MSGAGTLVFGKTGQVARSLTRYFPEAQFLDRGSVDLFTNEAIDRALGEFKPRLVILAAAYTDVERAESDQDNCAQVNVRAPAHIANWCKAHGASLINYSTDYVFNGSGQRPWLESDATGPLNFYGRSKLEGEQEILRSGCHAVILRTSWVYSEFQKNFLATMLRLGQERDTLSIVSDQIGAPTYADDLAKVTALIAKHHKFADTSGVFHFSNLGEISWYNFAVAIFHRLRARGVPVRVKEVQPISSSDFPSKAVRPLNSRLDTRKIRDTFGFLPRTWEHALDDCLRLVVR